MSNQLEHNCLPPYFLYPNNSILAISYFDIFKSLDSFPSPVYKIGFSAVWSKVLVIRFKFVFWETDTL